MRRDTGRVVEFKLCHFSDLIQTFLVRHWINFLAVSASRSELLRPPPSLFERRNLHEHWARRVPLLLSAGILGQDLSHRWGRGRSPDGPHDMYTISPDILFCHIRYYYDAAEAKSAGERALLDTALLILILIQNLFLVLDFGWIKKRKTSWAVRNWDCYCFIVSWHFDQQLIN